MYMKVVKRVLDKLLALFLLLIFLPFISLTALLVYFKIGRPIFFKQVRPGYQEQLFSIYKFRTMSNEKDAKGVLLADEYRLKKVGQFIRKTSLDELPQLLNVLKGEMSFVGPRPLLLEYLELYNDEQKKRHEVIPGITGWAQVNGRNAISWEEKFEYDIWYVDNQSFLLDMKILWMTFLKVIKRSDISSSGSVSMEKFEGSTK
ncbi:MAG: Lipid carrier : UDP-N-acetylgalactosaminyltransferase (EC [uncultured Sulfurovum sp.]|uniref:Lipid carrier: UDP-N-acetylgalactosaminyltransferase (EC) n=1 Tax=uncultured Sulfurovum sp. TaxID=269237 RepID=A0A6S6T7D2_9BACT|nr:MAG: Lipid carrier : UDP-N-acetylgalactosaminyltransferase (EC [uncultured Sulfurovum sp.]